MATLSRDLSLDKYPVETAHSGCLQLFEIHDFDKKVGSQQATDAMSTPSRNKSG
jgi:hypothetical protein